MNKRFLISQTAFHRFSFSVLLFERSYKAQSKIVVFLYGSVRSMSNYNNHNFVYREKIILATLIFHFNIFVQHFCDGMIEFCVVSVIVNDKL